MFSVIEANLCCVKKTGFLSHSGHKTAAAIDDIGKPDNGMFLPFLLSRLPVALIDCQVEGCALRLYEVYQGRYVATHEIDLDGAEQNICRNWVDKLQIGDKPEKLKKVGHNTVYRTVESEEEK